MATETSRDRLIVKKFRTIPKNIVEMVSWIYHKTSYKINVQKGTRLHIRTNKERNMQQNNINAVRNKSFKM